MDTSVHFHWNCLDIAVVDKEEVPAHFLPHHTKCKDVRVFCQLVLEMLSSWDKEYWQQRLKSSSSLSKGILKTEKVLVIWDMWHKLLKRCLEGMVGKPGLHHFPMQNSEISHVYSFVLFLASLNLGKSMQNNQVSLVSLPSIWQLSTTWIFSDNRWSRTYVYSTPHKLNLLEDGNATTSGTVFELWGLFWSCLTDHVMVVRGLPSFWILTELISNIMSGRLQPTWNPNFIIRNCSI